MQARQLAMNFAFELELGSLGEIGGKFGGKDHTTVIWAKKQVANLCETNKVFENDYNNLKKEIYGTYGK